MNLNVDKSQWTKVRLGDVATEYSSRINDPSSGDRERFVGSSCIGQWDFRVQEWESTASVTSAMKLFEEGDYLLVRRSLYASDFRERAPRAHFAGVCSGDILTIRENPEFIADGFLIGILNNPSIWSYIVANASGSITRRIKWKDLANYEFLLPPKDQQAEIAELLWAAYDSFQSVHELSTRIRQLRSTFEVQSVVPPTRFNLKEFDSWYSLEELVDSSICYGIVQPGPNVEGGVPVVQIKNMAEFSQEKMHFSSSQIESDYQRSRIDENALLFSVKGTIGRLAKVPKGFKGNIGRDIAKIEIHDANIRDFVFICLRSPRYQELVDRLKVGSTRHEISIATLRKVSVHLPSVDFREEVLEFHESLTKTILTQNRHRDKTREMISALTNSVFDVQ